jgi:hypothetical protein
MIDDWTMMSSDDDSCGPNDVEASNEDGEYKVWLEVGTGDERTASDESGSTTWEEDLVTECDMDVNDGTAMELEPVGTEATAEEGGVIDCVELERMDASDMSELE